MAALRILSILLSVPLARAWDVTSYFNASTKVFGGTITQSALIGVVTTGPVTGTSSIISTSSYVDGLKFTYAYNVTSIFLDPAASWCASQGMGYGTSKICTGTLGLLVPPPATTNPLLSTKYYIPVLITPPASCTMTSFSYTTTMQIDASGYPFPIADEATTGPSGEAIFITIITSLSTDLSGQAVTSSLIEVFLKPEAVTGVTPVIQASYLSQCIDPSSKECPSPTPNKSGFGGAVCAPSATAYPPIAQVAGGTTAAGTGTGTGSGAAPAATTSKSSGADLSHGSGVWGIYVAVATLAMSLFL